MTITKTVLAAAVLAAAMVAVASAATTTVVMRGSSLEESANPWKWFMCRQQLQGRDFDSCQRYVNPYGGVLEMSTGENQGREEVKLQACCQQLREVDNFQCGCEAIKRVVQQAQASGSWSHEGQSEQIFEKASSLPRMCRLRDRQCQISFLIV